MITQAQRDGLVAKMRWCHAHQSKIGYFQRRPMRTRPYNWGQFQTAVMDGKFEGENGPDCSELVDALFRWEGLGDPCGLNFNGDGDTQDMLNHLPHFIDWAKVHEGTIGIFTAGPLDTQHATIVLEPNGDNPLLFSHGGLNGPIEISLKELAPYLPGRKFVLLEVAHL